MKLLVFSAGGYNPCMTSETNDLRLQTRAGVFDLKETEDGIQVRTPNGYVNIEPKASNVIGVSEVSS